MIHNKGAKTDQSVQSDAQSDVRIASSSDTGSIQSEAVASADAQDGGTAQATVSNEATADEGSDVGQYAVSDATASVDGEPASDSDTNVYPP